MVCENTHCLKDSWHKIFYLDYWYRVVGNMPVLISLEKDKDQ
jgi:hypothetical protein